MTDDGSRTLAEVVALIAALWEEGCPVAGAPEKMAPSAPQVMWHQIK